jgi:membrane protein
MAETQKGKDWRAKVGERTDQNLSVDLACAREPGRGRDANMPEQIPLRGWSDILWRGLWSVRQTESCLLQAPWRMP